MTTFAQALARIEEISKLGPNENGNYELQRELLYDLTNSIVQLGKVAAEMRSSLQNIYDDEDNDYIGSEGADAYDNLMNGEEV